MAKEVFPRKPVTRPHTSIEVDTSGIGGSASNSEKVLCIIGKANGGEPNTVYALRNYAQAKRVFRSGELLDGIELAWNANPQYTAGKILAMRIEDAKPASFTHEGLKVISDIYGQDSNNIQVALEKNSLNSSYRLRVIFENDKLNLLYDNLGNIFNVTYSGKEATATMAVEKNPETGKASKLILKVGSNVVKTYELEGGLFTYTNEIVQDINQLPDFQAKVSPFGDKNIESKELDVMSEQSIKGKEVYVTSIFGDIQKQTAYNGLVHFERVYEQAPPSEPQVTPGEDTATVTANATMKTIEPFPLTKLSGGTNGEQPVSWASKLEKFAYEGGYYIVPLSDKQSVHAEVGHFVKARSEAGEPMRAIVGGGFNEPKEVLYGRVATLQNPRVSLIANSGIISMDDGRKLHAPAYMMASAIGGLACGLDIGESVTFKHLRVNSLDTVYDSSELDQLNENGVIAVEFVRNRLETNFRIVDDVTTYNDRTDPVKQEMAVGEANDFLVSELKIQLDDAFIGTRTINTSASIIKDFIISYLGRKKRDNEIQDFPPEDVQVIVEGSEARISLTVFPIRSLKKISVSLVYRQQILQA